MERAARVASGTSQAGHDCSFLVFNANIFLAQLKPNALAAQRQLYIARVLKPTPRTKSRDLAAHAVRLPLYNATLRFKEYANMQQVLVLQENALVTVLPLRTLP